VDEYIQETKTMNLIEKPTIESLQLAHLSFDHAPEKWEPLAGGGGTSAGMRVFVPARVDYFQDPAGKIVNDSAPYLWLPVTGDFVARAHVRPAFDTTYDAGAIMVRQDAGHWAKLCFESTDFGTKAAVSVVTRLTSDDANGVDLAVGALWLQVARLGDVFGMHYSLDGTSWRMVRLFNLKLSDKVRVGLVAQCPIGPGTTVDFLSFSVDASPLKDFRAGV
jgi:uncharacterized protein